MKIINKINKYANSISENKEPDRLMHEIVDEILNMSDDDIERYRIIKFLKTIRKYKLIKDVKYKYRDTETFNNFTNGSKTYEVCSYGKNFEMSQMTLVEKIELRIIIIKLANIIKAWEIPGFCYPAIPLQKKFKQNYEHENKSVIKWEGVERCLFYDDIFNSYNYIDRIFLIKKEDILNKDIYSIIDKEGSDFQLKLIIDIGNLDESSFKTLIQYLYKYTNCKSYLHGKINFKSISDFKLNY